MNSNIRDADTQAETKARFIDSSTLADSLPTAILAGLSLTDYFDENALRA